MSLHNSQTAYLTRPNLYPTSYEPWTGPLHYVTYSDILMKSKTRTVSDAELEMMEVETQDIDIVIELIVNMKTETRLFP